MYQLLVQEFIRVDDQELKVDPHSLSPSPSIGLRVGDQGLSFVMQVMGWEPTYFSAKESLLCACGVFELQPLSHLQIFELFRFLSGDKKGNKKKPKKETVSFCSLLSFLGIVAKEREYMVLLVHNMNIIGMPLLCPS